MSSPSLTAEMTVRSLHGELHRQLVAAGVERASDEARDILAAVLDRVRFWPMLHPDHQLTARETDAARAAGALRSKGAPFAYAVGRAAFRSLTLAVDGRVLIPRQETEELVDAILALDLRGTAVDVGTGSGAIALSLASEGWFDRVIATDVSLDALSVARENIARCKPALRAPVELRHGVTLTPVVGVGAALLVSNPPYIANPEAVELPRSVRDWEPPLALFSGVDGMDVTRVLIADAPRVLAPRGVLALEIDHRRAESVVDCLSSQGSFTDITVRLDLSGRERFVLARLQG